MDLQRRSIKAVRDRMSGNTNERPKRDPTCTSIESPIYLAQLAQLCRDNNLPADIRFVGLYNHLFDFTGLKLVEIRALPQFFGGLPLFSRKYHQDVVVYGRRSTPSKPIHQSRKRVCILQQGLFLTISATAITLSHWTILLLRNNECIR